MTKRGQPQTAAGRATQLRTLRARKRKFPGSEDTAPAGDNETLQPGEPQGSSVCVPTSSGQEECRSLLSKDVKASDSCPEVKSLPGETKSLQFDSNSAERGASPSFQAPGGSSASDQAREPDNNPLALCDTKCAVHPVLESVPRNVFTDNERGALQQHGIGYIEAPSGDSCGETGRRDAGAEIREYPSAAPSHTAPCPPGSLPPVCDGREVSRGPSAADSVKGKDGEKQKATNGTGDHSTDQTLFGQGRGTAPDAEPIWSAMGGQCEDGPTKRKMRKRMGMWGFGERERRTHCEGQLTSRNQKNGESNKGRETEGKVARELLEEHYSDCHKEVTGRRLQVAIFNMVANGKDLTTTDGSPDAAQGHGGRPASDLSLPSALDSILEEEQPSQPVIEASYKLPQPSFTVEKTVAGVTKSSCSTVHTEKTTSGEGTSPCGPEGDGPGVSGGRSGVSCTEPRGTFGQMQRDPRGCPGTPSTAQEEDCDLGSTVPEEVLHRQGGRGTSQVQRWEAPKVRGCSSFEPEASLGLNPTQSGTVAVLCDGVEGISQLAPKGLAVSQTSDEVTRGRPSAGTGPVSCGAQGPGEESRPVEPLGVECVGLGPRQVCASLLQGVPVTKDIGEHPELEGGTCETMEDSIKAHLHEPVMETEDVPAPGLIGASTEEHQHPPANHVTVTVDVPFSRANGTGAQRTSDQASNMNPDQHQERGDLLNMVSSHDVQERGGGSYLFPVCASVLQPACQDKSLPWHTELVHNLHTEPSRAQSPKPNDAPDSDPDSLCSLSDSQLNNITLSGMDDASEPVPADPREDASELVCGLIKELSFLNRTVMAAHRELDSIRRGSKPPKASVRRSYGSRRSEM